MGIPVIETVVDEGLGNSSHLVDLGDGRALAVDASRDLRALREAARRRGLRVAFAADTHLHADFLTGALQLAADDDAQVLAAAAGRRAYPHRGLGDGEEVDLGGLTLRALATPGHTDEHLAFLLLDGARPLGVFSGGSLIVGSAARTDLVDPDRTRDLALAQYRSVRRLAALPDETALWPTHGAGSFCAAPPGGERTSTIGAQKATNPLLSAPDADTFADLLIGGLGDFPPYFLRLADLNRSGPAPLRSVPPPERLDASRVRAALADGAVLVDVRPVEAFAAGHVPGALSIALRPQFATWLGWLLDPATPWIVVRDPGQDPAEITWQAAKIGHPAPLGELPLADWNGGHATMPLLRPGTTTGRRVIDVRQPTEYATGHLPGAVNLPLGDATGTGTPEGPSVVMCGHGERAATAASVLLRAGHDTAVLSGGPHDWAEATGQALEQGR
ncbi:MBL fold metallo-hydrolase [Thermomonospora umbrina]|uniref:Glyoxylase-like metal-dependent hydrolase (Beta-lactamase superfamily II) n=1 Tax=Thermomonospora umbrina TaxID=111806 RepID=A0A3D9T113_9ACTN|nr:MBL fold metallo-hydrolase [Thermomonospora umbrina]REF00511.1 glyoxylase-like metal-dependent hydrolase (beta-lactamase superfamily II) [Thermomonospora umbrina]